MGIARTIEWKMLCAPEEALPVITSALGSADFEISDSEDGFLRAAHKAAWLKNRYAAKVEASIAPLPDKSTAVTWRVDMSGGTKHYEVLDDIADQIDDGFFDDQGISAALAQLRATSKLSGRRELRHLRNVLHADEHVAAIGQGILGKKQGIVVLTDRRLFFLEKSMMGNESLDEYSLDAIQALSIQKKSSGERLVIAGNGLKGEIHQMSHGQADTIASAFHRVKSARNTPTPAPPTAVAADDPMAQLQKLNQLLEAGLITADEFQAKRAAILDRI